MLTRTLSALVLSPLVLAAAWWGPPWPILILVAAAGAIRETYAIVRAGGHRPTAVAAVPLLLGLGSLPFGWPAIQVWPSDLAVTVAPLSLAAAVSVAFIAQMLRSPDQRSTADWALSLAVPLYVTAMAAMAIALRGLEQGASWTVAWLVLTWVNDSFAYLGGRRFGRRLMAPVLSPRKTWEGLFSASLATMAATPLAALASATPWLVGFEVPLAGLVAMALVVSVAGPLGDLSVSFLKRQSQVKDSGHLIPGHGGVLDRTDSLLFAAPWVFLVAWLASAL